MDTDKPLHPVHLPPPDPALHSLDSEGPRTPAPSTAPSGALSSSPRSPPAPPPLRAVADRLAAAGGLRTRGRVRAAAAGVGAVATAGWHQTLDFQRWARGAAAPLIEPVDRAARRAATLVTSTAGAAFAVPRGAAADVVAAGTRVALVIAIVWLLMGIAPLVLALAIVAGVGLHKARRAGGSAE